MPQFLMDQSLSPGLYIVATPIGNLGDMTSRAAETLRRVDYILAEDKRVTAKLLAYIGATAPMTSYNDHSDEKLRLRILSDLGSKAVALVSDAGTPLISDPGYKLVRAARSAGHAVHALPGPCAAIAALTLSGLPTDRFLFLGFLPPKSSARREALKEIAGVRATLIVYESAPRLAACLDDLRLVLGDRDGAVLREITKLHEDIVTGSLSFLAQGFAGHTPKGEIVIVVSPPLEPEAVSDTDLDAALRDAMAKFSLSRAASDVAERLGVPRKRAYARALDLAGKD
jgi:16S rRNA (cytidine1402-2'-O)-methyltransferase